MGSGGGQAFLLCHPSEWGGGNILAEQFFILSFSQRMAKKVRRARGDNMALPKGTLPAEFFGSP